MRSVYTLGQTQPHLHTSLNGYKRVIVNLTTNSERSKSATPTQDPSRMNCISSLIDTWIPKGKTPIQVSLLDNIEFWFNTFARTTLTVPLHKMFSPHDHRSQAPPFDFIFWIPTFLPREPRGISNRFQTSYPSNQELPEPASGQGLSSLLRCHPFNRFTSHVNSLANRHKQFSVGRMLPSANGSDRPPARQGQDITTP